MKSRLCMLLVLVVGACGDERSSATQSPHVGRYVTMNASGPVKYMATPNDSARTADRVHMLVLSADGTYRKNWIVKSMGEWADPKSIFGRGRWRVVAGDPTVIHLESTDEPATPDRLDDMELRVDGSRLIFLEDHFWQRAP